MITGGFRVPLGVEAPGEQSLIIFDFTKVDF